MNKKILTRIFSLSLGFAILLSGCDYLDTYKAEQTTFNGKTIAASDCSYGGEIKSVQAIDAHTVTFTLCKPDAAFAAKMASPIFAIQDEDVLNATGGDSSLLSENIVGTGVFRLTSWEKGNQITLGPSTSYWGIPALPEAIEFLWEPGAGKRYGYVSFRSVDGLDAPPASLIASIRTNSSLKSYQHPLNNLVYIGFNNTIAPFDNVEVRRAFALAIDRAAIFDQYFPLGSELATQLVPISFSPGHSNAMDWYARNQAEAKALLESANFDFAQEITLAVPEEQMGSVELPARIGILISNELDEINVRVKVKIMPLAILQESLRAGTEMAYLYWYTADYPDAAAFYEGLLKNSSRWFGNSYTDIQQEVEKTLSTTDANARQEAFDRLNTMVKDQVPLIPLGHAANISVFRTTVNNAAVNYYYENFENMGGEFKKIQYYGIEEPEVLWPADEDNYQTFRITRLLYDTLLAPGFGDVTYSPLLAESWESSDDLTQWTFHLRYNVRFSDNATFDANDVVTSFAAIWDAKDVNHKGRTGEFAYFRRLFGNLLNE